MIRIASSSDMMIKPGHLAQEAGHGILAALRTCRGVGLRRSERRALGLGPHGLQGIGSGRWHHETDLDRLARRPDLDAGRQAHPLDRARGDLRHEWRVRCRGGRARGSHRSPPRAPCRGRRSVTIPRDVRRARRSRRAPAWRGPPGSSPARARRARRRSSSPSLGAQRAGAGPGRARACPRTGSRRRGRPRSGSPDGSRTSAGVPDLRDPAVLEEHEPVGERHRLDRIVRDEDARARRRPRACRGAASAGRACAEASTAASGSSSSSSWGSARERSGERHALLFAAGQRRAGRAAGSTPGARSCEQPSAPPRGPRVARSPRARAANATFSSALIRGNSIAVLEREADPAALGSSVVDPAVAQLDAAVVQRDESGERLEHRGLSRRRCVRRARRPPRRRRADRHRRGASPRRTRTDACRPISALP